MSSSQKPITTEIIAYMDALLDSESEAAAGLRRRTYAHEQASMMSWPAQTQFLSFLIKTLKMRRVLEVGTYTGYSTLRFAEALPKDGVVVTCDIHPDWCAVGEPYWQQAGVREKIQLCIGPAVETLKTLLQQEPQLRFDFAYIDADKIHYPEYYDLCWQLLANDGWIAIDNVLWVGDCKVVAQENPSTRAVYRFNQQVIQDNRFEWTLLPTGEGLLLGRKK